MSMTVTVKIMPVQDSENSYVSPIQISESERGNIVFTLTDSSGSEREIYITKDDLQKVAKFFS